MLTRLGHGTVRRGDDEDRAVHLGGARDHVLDVVRVSRAVDVGVVPRLRLVLDVRGRDRDAALLLLGRVVDLGERLGLAAHLLREDGGDGSGQGRLAVIDVTDGPNVDVRLVALELCLAHFERAPLESDCRWANQQNYRMVSDVCGATPGGVAHVALSPDAKKTGPTGPVRTAGECPGARAMCPWSASCRSGSL